VAILSSLDNSSDHLNKGCTRPRKKLSFLEE